MEMIYGAVATLGFRRPPVRTPSRHTLDATGGFSNQRLSAHEEGAAAARATN
jgi:hypothetical protein